MIEYTKEQIEYITGHGGVIDDSGFIRITYKSFRKLPKDYAARDICDRHRHVWLIPGQVMHIENRHFILVKRLD